MTRERSGDRGARARWLDDGASPARRALRQAFDDAALARETEGDALPAGERERLWARVQSPWMTERPRRFFAGPIFALAGAALIVLAATALLLRPGTRPVATRSVPSQHRAPSITALPPARTLTTAGAAERHRLARGVDAELARDSALDTGDEETAPAVRAGRVRFTVPKQSPGQRYTVLAGGYRVVVVGTVFDVSIAGDTVGVSVESGVVNVEESGTGQVLRRLERGERWDSQASAPIERGVPAHATMDAPRRPASRVPEGDPGAAAILAQAREARGAGDPRRALALYERLAERGGPLAESALYEVGAIEAEDLHDSGGALRAWRRYRDRFPHGVLRAEADLSVVEALARRGDGAQALDEARAFLRLHPRSERRGEVARVAGDIARTRGDCRAAVELYDLAARGPLSGPDADDTVFARAACLHALRDDRADEATRDYLARFPTGRHVGEAKRLVMGQAAEPPR